jgi:hypothetical protein
MSNQTWPQSQEEKGFDKLKMDLGKYCICHGFFYAIKCNVPSLNIIFTNLTQLLFESLNFLVFFLATWAILATRLHIGAR